MFSIFSIFKKPAYHLKQTDFRAQLKQDSKAQVIDVRTPGEFAGKHMPKAKNIDFFSRDFKEKALKLPKDKTYYVYCRSGQLSGQAAKFLHKNGYTVYNLTGGYSGWN